MELCLFFFFPSSGILRGLMSTSICEIGFSLFLSLSLSLPCNRTSGESISGIYRTAGDHHASRRSNFTDVTSMRSADAI